MTAVNFDRQDLSAAAEAALRKVTDPRWTRAIERAMLHLSVGRFLFDGRYAVIHSATSEQLYKIDTEARPLVCECQAAAKGLICWHIAGGLLLRRAAERHAAILEIPPRKARVLDHAGIQARADALYN